MPIIWSGIQTNIQIYFFEDRIASGKRLSKDERGQIQDNNKSKIVNKNKCNLLHLMQSYAHEFCLKLHNIMNKLADNDKFIGTYWNQTEIIEFNWNWVLLLLISYCCSLDHWDESSIPNEGVKMRKFIAVIVIIAGLLIGLLGSGQAFFATAQYIYRPIILGMIAALIVALIIGILSWIGFRVIRARRPLFKGFVFALICGAV